MGQVSKSQVRLKKICSRPVADLRPIGGVAGLEALHEDIVSATAPARLHADQGEAAEQQDDFRWLRHRRNHR